MKTTAPFERMFADLIHVTEQLPGLQTRFLPSSARSLSVQTVHGFHSVIF
jgi:hypothetical protein